MATLRIPDRQKTLTDFGEIQAYLKEWGVWHDRWEAAASFAPDADQETVLAAYAHVLKPYMEVNGYKTADVINIHPAIEGLQALRDKFLAEHTHTEDEVRFFVEGIGYFWFNLPDEPVFCVKCTAGDLLSVPANTPHWFNLAEPPNVKAIRIFIDQAGWVPHYTESGIDKQYGI